jgi:hypothetical protein
MEIIQPPHVLYAKDVQEMHLENSAQILLPHNTCGATLSACFLQYFNAIFMWKQHEPFYQFLKLQGHFGEY